MTPVRDPDDAAVTYTVKELLAKIQTDQVDGFGRLETAMNGKADAADVARLEERVEGHSNRLVAVESHIGTLRTLLGAGVTLCVALGGIGGFLAAVHVI